MNMDLIILGKVMLLLVMIFGIGSIAVLFEQIRAAVRRRALDEMRREIADLRDTTTTDRLHSHFAIQRLESRIRQVESAVDAAGHTAGPDSLAVGRSEC